MPRLLPSPILPLSRRHCATGILFEKFEGILLSRAIDGSKERKCVKRPHFVRRLSRENNALTHAVWLAVFAGGVPSPAAATPSSARRATTRCIPLAPAPVGLSCPRRKPATLANRFHSLTTAVSVSWRCAPTGSAASPSASRYLANLLSPSSNRLRLTSVRWCIRQCGEEYHEAFSECSTYAEYLKECQYDGLSLALSNCRFTNCVVSSPIPGLRVRPTRCPRRWPSTSGRARRTSDSAPPATSSSKRTRAATTCTQSLPPVALSLSLFPFHGRTSTHQRVCALTTTHVCVQQVLHEMRHRLQLV